MDLDKESQIFSYETNILPRVNFRSTKKFDCISINLFFETIIAVDTIILYASKVKKNSVPRIVKRSVFF